MIFTFIKRLFNKGEKRDVSDAVGVRGEKKSPLPSLSTVGV